MENLGEKEVLVGVRLGGGEEKNMVGVDTMQEGEYALAE